MSETDAGGEVAAAIAAYAPRSLSARAVEFARAVVAKAAPARAKALLFAAAKLAAFGESVGLELCAEVLLDRSVIERFIVLGASTISAPTRRTLRTNLRALARASEPILSRLPRHFPASEPRPSIARPRSPAIWRRPMLSAPARGGCAPSRWSAWGRARG